MATPPATATAVTTIACYVCNTNITCPCIGERQFRPKERTCALFFEKWPRSYIGSDGDGEPARVLLHICSRKCEAGRINQSMAHHVALGNSVTCINDLSFSVRYKREDGAETTEERRARLLHRALAATDHRGAPTTQASFREAIHKQNSKISDPHCLICGDTAADDGPLIEAMTMKRERALFCKTCYTIQMNM